MTITLESARRWARGAVILGISVSITGNVADTLYTATDVSPLLRVPLAVVWPVFMFVAIEVLVRVPWSKSKLSKLAQALLLMVSVPTAITSFIHLRDLLTKAGENGVATVAGPLSIDGFMIGSTVALLVVRALMSKRDEQREQVPVSTLPMSTATAHDAVVSEAAMRGEHPDGSSLWTPVTRERINEQTLTVPAVPSVGEQVDEAMFSLSTLMSPGDVRPVSSPPVPLPQRKRTSNYDVQELLTLIDDGLTDTAIGAMDDMPSRATVQRVRVVYVMLRQDPLADVSGMNVSPEVAQIIRASVQR